MLFRRSIVFRFCLAGMFLISAPAIAVQTECVGHVFDIQGQPVADAKVLLISGDRNEKLQTSTDRTGRFRLTINPTHSYSVHVTSKSFQPLSQAIVPGGGEAELQLQPLLTRSDTVVVTADINQIDVLSPDPAEKVYVRQDLIDANPGRPGAPISIPGYPIETASSGIKAPQYFAPGVAGDHGEPIAQYLAVGGYLVPNNLSANAHGNGYADPNIFIPGILESVQVDGGAFNVREGNHSVNVAAIYGLRSRLDPFVTLTGDYRDLDLVAGMTPVPNSLIAIEASYGNGFLKRPEHRQQYKLNGQRVFKLGDHELTLLGVGYYGFSNIAGLIPIFLSNGDDAHIPNVGDTIDPRQKDQTHTALIAANDSWRLRANQQLQLSGFFRTYNLSLFSNFGQGLIRQSEFRTVTGQSTNYVNKFAETFSLLGGLDYQREAPRRDNLDHYNFYAPGNPSYGSFTKIDSNNVTLTSVTPYGAGSGTLTHFVRYYAGWRRDQINIANDDLIHTQNSFQKWIGVNSPKATVSFIPKEAWPLPVVSGSFGQAFFTGDPRIGTGSAPGTPVATAHSYQLMLSKTIKNTDLKLTVGHVTISQELAKIDPDTGLQQNQGPGRLRFLTTVVRRNFSQASILATFSKADARDVESREPTPEAPRTIFDLLGNLQSLPFGIEAQGEFEYVGRKPLGTGCQTNLGAQCAGSSVKEFRAAAVRPFLDQRFSVGLNMLVAAGYTGQTIETFYPSNVQEVAGVRVPTYASVSVTYRFSRSLHLNKVP